MPRREAASGSGMRSNNDTAAASALMANSIPEILVSRLADQRQSLRTGVCAEIAVVIDLFDNKVRDVCAGNKSATPVPGIGEHAIGARLRPVGAESSGER